MSGQRSDERVAARAASPDVDRVVGTAGGQQPTVRREGEAEDGIVLREYGAVERSLCLRIPQPHDAVVAARRDLTAVGAERDREYTDTAPHHPAHLVHIVGLPQPHAAVV